MTRVDLHLQSRFSSRASEWALRKAGVAPSYSDPKELYTSLREAGFSFFTLTDHHTLDGCLELEGLPGVFLSEKVTALFPEDRAPVDVLIWGLSQSQHHEIASLRSNLYELHSYLITQKLAHAVAHPFHCPEGRLLAGHIEKLLLLFKHFEVLNGMRSEFIHEFTTHFLRALTPDCIATLANRHNIDPFHDRPWEKVFTGGSNDVSGVFPGRAWTGTADTNSADFFLEHVRMGRCEAGGSSGGPLTVAHGMYKNLTVALGQRFEPVRRSALLKHALARFMEGKDPTSLSWGEKLALAADGIVSGKLFELLKPANASLWKALAGAVEGDALAEALNGRLSGIHRPEERAFQMANHFVGRLTFQFFQSFIAQAAEGNLIKAIQDLAVLLPVLAPLTPYFVELKRESPRRHWLEMVSRSVHSLQLPTLTRRKFAWITDTLEDVNGVSMTIRTMAKAGIEAGYEVEILTCKGNSQLKGVPMRNFEPIGEFALPEYELQKLAFPPVLELIEYIYKEGFTEVILSTPGPLGLVGLLAAKLLGLPLRGIYHTDFPRYVGILTEDAAMESLAWTYMHWFYTGLDLLYVNSEPYREAWTARGADPSKIRILPRGVNVDLFNPGRKQSDFWLRRGAAPGRKVLLYVGRVSKEKDLDMLVPLMHSLGGDATLAVVGDGPYLAELKTLLPDAIFTGYLLGDVLATAYASADVFLFPSTTDTYGNVVVEALASGIPCVVSDAGGPAGLVRDGRTGFVSKARDEKDLAARVSLLVSREGVLEEMKQAIAEEYVSSTWSRAAGEFFEEQGGPFKR